MKKEARKCVVCGKKFAPKTKNAAYCSEKCYKVAKAKRDKARKEAIRGSLKDAKKVAEKKPTKKLSKKVVKAECNEKIRVSKPKRFVVIKHGDAIRFDNFTPDQIFHTAFNIAILACNLHNAATLKSK